MKTRSPVLFTLELLTVCWVRPVIYQQLLLYDMMVNTIVFIRFSSSPLHLSHFFAGLSFTRYHIMHLDRFDVHVYLHENNPLPPVLSRPSCFTILIASFVCHWQVAKWCSGLYQSCTVPYTFVIVRGMSHLLIHVVPLCRVCHIPELHKLLAQPTNEEADRLIAETEEIVSGTLS